MITKEEYLTDVDSMIKAIELDSEAFREVRASMINKYGQDVYSAMFRAGLAYIRVKYFADSEPLEKSYSCITVVHKDYFGDSDDPLFI